MTSRCAVHPGRPASDSCPVCARPRCRADAQLSPGGGCVACRGDLAAPPTPPLPPDGERLVRAALAATVAALAGGVVASEYVEAPYFAYLAPLIVGLLVAAAATRAARTDGTGLLGGRVRAISIAYALVGCAFGFLTQPGTPSPFDDLGGKLLPYLCSVAGAVLWCLPPRRVPAPVD
ncbi:MAG: hypothetical protein Q8R60_17565 [Mycobacteriales bacterium]|nr:hypothetical protein [Mycobacteriales bacterium]